MPTPSGRVAIRFVPTFVPSVAHSSAIGVNVAGWTVVWVKYSFDPAATNPAE